MKRPKIEGFKSPCVLICGAGPTGLTLACELVRRGVEVRIIDELPKPTTQSRALAVQPRTLEIFERMGVLDSFLEKGLKVTQINLYHHARKEFELKFDVIESAFPFLLSIPQADTEKILIHHLELLGCHVERGVRVLSIQKGCAFLHHPDGNEELFSPKWIVGCDGAHSQVRHNLNFSFKGIKLPELFALADLTLEGPLIHSEGHFFFENEGVFAFVPLTESNTFRMILPLKEQISPEQLTQDFFSNFLQKRAPYLHVKKTSWTSLFSIHRRIAPSFRKKNVFLAGDAAHIHSPAGGQGMNTGIQDAYNLAWKLALVHQGRGHHILLKSYNQERYPIAQKVLFFTTIITRFVTSSPPFVKKSFLFFMKKFKSASREKKLISAVADLSIQYKSSILYQPIWDLFWKAPKLGERAPDMQIARSGNQLFSYFHEEEHTLLTFGPISAELKQILCGYKISVFHSGDEEEILRRYHAEPTSVFLIRPDGYIGYRSSALKKDHLLRYLKKIFTNSGSGHAHGQGLGHV
jgi:2-polyprenyl-6-methoxyphenol hydroxylase-like FAD-dependent oxidoreductase